MVKLETTAVAPIALAVVFPNWEEDASIEVPSCHSRLHALAGGRCSPPDPPCLVGLWPPEINIP